MAVMRDSWVLVGHLNNIICSTKLKETIKQKSSTTLKSTLRLPMAEQWAPLGTRVSACQCSHGQCSCLVCEWDWYLTHWGRMMHICVSNLTIIGSDNGLSPGWPQAINWTNAWILLIGPLGTKFSEILIRLPAFFFLIQENAFESVDCEMAAILSRHQCVKWSILSLTFPSSTLILQWRFWRCK